MARITAPTQALLVDGAPAMTSMPPSHDPQVAEPHTVTRSPKKPEARSIEKPRRKSRPDQVDPRPLPPLEEWFAVQDAGSFMYYGFYADDNNIEKVLINCFPDHLGHKDPDNTSLFYPALLFLRKHFKRRDISVATAILPQWAKDLNPEIEDDVGDHVLILGLFPLEEEAYLNRMTQAEVDELADLMGTKPTWWPISQPMPSI